MNEFIVWDGNKFYQDSSYSYLTLRQDGKVYEESNDDYGGNTSTLTTLKPLFYIGTKDINNKKIYSDCSIVDLNYFQSSDWVNDTAFFKWDEEMLRYEVHLIREKEIVPFDPSYFDNMKIIDTLQENKLGLIKDK